MSDNLTTRLLSLASSLAGASTGTLEAIRTAIAALRGPGAADDFQTTRQAINNLAGPAPGKSLADVYENITALWNSLDSLEMTVAEQHSEDRLLLTRIATALENGLFFSTQSEQPVISVGGQARYAYLHGISGNETAVDLDRIEELLGAIRDCACSSAGLPLLPPETGEGSCSAPFVYTTYSTLVGEKRIEWTNTLPENAQVTGNVMYMLGDVTFDGWRIWVSSSAAYFTSFGATVPLPTNKWVSMDGMDAVSVSVPERHDLVAVYLCNDYVEPPPAGTWGVVELSSVPGDGFYVLDWAVALSTFPDASTTTTALPRDTLWTTADRTPQVLTLLSYNGTDYIRVYEEGGTILGFAAAEVSISKLVPGNTLQGLYLVSFDAPFMVRLELGTAP